MKIHIYFQPLPKDIYGAAIRDGKDHSEYFLFCDTAARSIQQRRHTFGHELAHILEGHFDTKDALTFYQNGERKALYQNGKYIAPTDKPLDRDNHSEHSADRNAWHYYRRFRDQFIQAEETGRAFIEI